MNGNCRSNDIHEITLQFHPSLFSNPAFQKNQFDSIMKMMAKSRTWIGIRTSRDQPHTTYYANDIYGKRILFGHKILLFSYMSSPCRKMYAFYLKTYLRNIRRQTTK